MTSQEMRCPPTMLATLSTTLTILPPTTTTILLQRHPYFCDRPLATQVQKSSILSPTTLVIPLPDRDALTSLSDYTHNAIAYRGQTSCTNNAHNSGCSSARYTARYTACYTARNSVTNDVCTSIFDQGRYSCG
ncbi:hypothetical protein BDP27DRAFT_864375 [Rhodocollybia butyracea]|uniref:Uncharacterized protein n=1 Tax=Rhodocollybia butyracea TaxID=206335 RepID=A0A9P5P5E9_9AGAR|nr:hypothetical protein BDP27DRAFT_864375 [Rhodocollybia butyracea]